MPSLPIHEKVNEPLNSKQPYFSDGSRGGRSVGLISWDWCMWK